MAPAVQGGLPCHNYYNYYAAQRQGRLPGFLQPNRPPRPPAGPAPRHGRGPRCGLAPGRTRPGAAPATPTKGIPRLLRLCGPQASAGRLGRGMGRLGPQRRHGPRRRANGHSKRTVYHAWQCVHLAWCTVQVDRVTPPRLSPPHSDPRRRPLSALCARLRPSSPRPQPASAGPPRAAPPCASCELPWG
jgi:hypothetical protein